MSTVDRPNGAMARNVRRVGHLDLPGAGQVTVADGYAYVGHIQNKQGLGTSIIDIFRSEKSARGDDRYTRRSGLA
jgi:hypothetical protein